MKFNQIAALRDRLEQMETQQLDAMLLEELRKEAPDGQLVRMIGSVLQQRDQNTLPPINESVERAWEQYQRKTQPVHKKRNRIPGLLVKAACLILVLAALVTLLPREASARNFFQRFIAWTEDVFSLTSPAENRGRSADYEFRTDNPGLQQVYDQVTELGVTVPVVPMWLPEGYELVECRVNDSPAKKNLMAAFSNGDASIIYQIDIYSDNVTHEFFMDNKGVQTHEQNGVIYTIFRNNDLWVAIWTTDNMECSIFIDCPEETLKRILDSIYTMEET